MICTFGGLRALFIGANPGLAGWSMPSDHSPAPAAGDAAPMAQLVSLGMGGRVRTGQGGQGDPQDKPQCPTGADRPLPGPYPAKRPVGGRYLCPGSLEPGGGGAVISARAGAELVANRPHGVGRLSLGLACPYQARIRLQLWQGPCC